MNFGQVHECTVEIGNFANDAKALEKVKDASHRRHEELYTFPSRITRWKSSTSKARSTDTSTNRNRRASVGDGTWHDDPWRAATA